MRDKPRIIALVPMRHESERVPGKNYRCFAGRPLFNYIIEALVTSECFDEVVIDTDSPVIMDDARNNFPGVRLLERPRHLRGGSTPMNAVLLNTIGEVSGDYYLQTHCTNPLLSAPTIACAVKTFLENLGCYDSLFSVKRLQSRLWSASCGAINHDPERLLRTQDLPPVYAENSCIYLFSRQSLVKRGNRIGERPLMFEMNSIESVDIDEEIDFRLAELLFLNKDKLGVCSS